MKTSENAGYVKRTQKDYSISFKLQVVQEIELGHLSRSEACHKYGIQAKSTIREWLRKYGTFDWENQSQTILAKTPEQKILELEAKVKLLELTNEICFILSIITLIFGSIPTSRHLKLNLVDVSNV